MGNCASTCYKDGSSAETTLPNIANQNITETMLDQRKEMPISSPASPLYEDVQGSSKQLGFIIREFEKTIEKHNNINIHGNSLVRQDFTVLNVPETEIKIKNNVSNTVEVNASCSEASQEELPCLRSIKSAPARNMSSSGSLFCSSNDKEGSYNVIFTAKALFRAEQLVLNRGMSLHLRKHVHEVSKPSRIVPSSQSSQRFYSSSASEKIPAHVLEDSYLHGMVSSPVTHIQRKSKDVIPLIENSDGCYSMAQASVRETFEKKSESKQRNFSSPISKACNAQQRSKSNRQLSFPARYEDLDIEMHQNTNHSASLNRPAFMRTNDFTPVYGLQRLCNASYLQPLNAATGSIATLPETHSKQFLSSDSSFQNFPSNGTVNHLQLQRVLGKRHAASVWKAAQASHQFYSNQR